MAKRIFITGANGFIGRNIVNKLKNTFDIVGCGRSPKNSSNADHYVQWNIGNEEEPSVSIEQVDCIVHCAACLDKDNLSKDVVQTNCVGAFNLLRYAVKHRINKIIFMSSLPIVESAYFYPITEKSALNPQSLYHATKASAEMILCQARHFGIQFISLRVPSPIGPDMPRKTIVPIFIQRTLNNEDIVIQGKGTRKQNYIDVRDIADAVEKIIEHKEIEGIFNIGARDIISNYELANLCIKCTGSNSSIILSGIDPNDSVDWSTDDSKLISYIGSYQSRSLNDSIIDIANAMR